MSVISVESAGGVLLIRSIASHAIGVPAHHRHWAHRGSVTVSVWLLVDSSAGSCDYGWCHHDSWCDSNAEPKGWSNSLDHVVPAVSDSWANHIEGIEGLVNWYIINEEVHACDLVGF